MKNALQQSFKGALAVVATLAFVSLAATADARPHDNTPRGGIKKMVVEEAMASRVPPSLALAVAKVESDFQANALSSKGARGVMQIMPKTAADEWGVEADELWNPRLNIRLGIDFLERLIDRYEGDWELALSYYNGGSRVGKPGRARVLPWTRKYVDAVLRWERRYAGQRRVWLALVDRENSFNGIRQRGNGTRVARWRPHEQRIADAAGRVNARMMSSEREYDAHNAETQAGEQPRVTWKKAKRRIKKSLPRARRWTPNRRRMDDFAKMPIEERRRAIKGTLDDFTSPYDADEG